MNYNNTNLILMADSYKYSHNLQTPKGTEFITSSIEARGADDPDYKSTVFFGLQMFIKKYMLTPITMADVEEAKLVIEAHGLPFNYEGWKIIVEEFDGKLPITIEALPEGTVVGLKNVLVQIKNTDKRFAWLTSFIETIILRDVWYPTTVATNSWTIKQFMKEYYEKSGSVEGLDFKLHDFGNRGVSSAESAEMGGIAHLINYMGTDTVPALLAGRRYYDIEMAGFSIIAAEHSTITPWGEAGEADAYRNMISLAKPGGAVAVVSDSYDMINAARNIWGKELKQAVIDSGATIVVRPDSGDPTTVPVEVIEILMEEYGFTYNSKGYKTLPSCIRVIQGDGINKDSIKQILANLEAANIALDNLAFGMGGALLQGVNRDTLQFAMKANEIQIYGETKDVYKSPKTDPNKASKRGAQAVIIEDGEYKTIRKSLLKGKQNELREVYKDGELLIEDSFDTIRERAA